MVFGVLNAEKYEKVCIKGRKVLQIMQKSAQSKEN
jgi:hypothetical protein